LSGIKEFFDNLHGIEDARKLFPVTGSCIYLDSAHYSPFSLETRRRLIEFIDDYTYRNTNLTKANFRIASRLRKKCAGLIGAHPDDIIITNNTSHGLNTFTNGIKLEKGDAVVYPDCEFPAIAYSWMNQERLRGIKNVTIASYNWRIDLNDIEEAIKRNNAKVLTISSVEFLGFRNDLHAISKICKKHDCYFVVDAIQSAGIVPINVKELEIDFFAAGSQKWMMAPAGIGFAYISPSVKAKVDPTYVNTANVDYDFKNFLDYKLNFRKDAVVYENSTLNVLGMIGLESSIDLFMKLKVENIFKYILNLIDEFINGLNGSNYTIESDLGPVHRSNILIFSHNDRSKNPGIQKSLEAENIFIALREGYLRISPHIFNNEEEIKKLISVLRSF
jgi:cysteine desulfurase/selenocysteine lyase